MRKCFQLFLAENLVFVCMLIKQHQDLLFKNRLTQKQILKRKSWYFKKHNILTRFFKKKFPVMILCIFYCKKKKCGLYIITGKGPILFKKDSNMCVKQCKQCLNVCFVKKKVDWGLHGRYMSIIWWNIMYIHKLGILQKITVGKTIAAIIISYSLNSLFA